MFTRTWWGWAHRAGGLTWWQGQTLVAELGQPVTEAPAHPQVLPETLSWCWSDLKVGTCRGGVHAGQGCMWGRAMSSTGVHVGEGHVQNRGACGGACKTEVHGEKG